MLLLKLPNDSSVDMFKAKGFLSILLKTLAATVRASLHWSELLKKSLRTLISAKSGELNSTQVHFFQNIRTHTGKLMNLLM